LGRNIPVISSGGKDPSLFTSLGRFDATDAEAREVLLSRASEWAGEPDSTPPEGAYDSGHEGVAPSLNITGEPLMAAVNEVPQAEKDVMLAGARACTSRSALCVVGALRRYRLAVVKLLDKRYTDGECDSVSLSEFQSECEEIETDYRASNQEG